MPEIRIVRDNPIEALAQQPVKVTAAIAPVGGFVANQHVEQFRHRVFLETVRRIVEADIFG